MRDTERSYKEHWAALTGRKPEDLYTPRALREAAIVEEAEAAGIHLTPEDFGPNGTLDGMEPEEWLYAVCYME